jgi:diguanylate cyclase (GGDEF)-like protein
MFDAAQTGPEVVLILQSIVPGAAQDQATVNSVTQGCAAVPATAKPGSPAGFPHLVHAPVPETLADAINKLQEIESQLDRAVSTRERLQAENKRLMQKLEAASCRAVAAQRVAHHDGLTGLPNRLFLIGRMQKAVAAARQRQGQLALLFIDLDGFKTVNDDLGHGVADRLLKAVASRIAACVRSDDIACRYGGDEFVALLTNLNDASIADELLQKVRGHIAEDYTIAGHRIRITASIGLAVYPEHGDRYDLLMSHADAAMYRDKVSRRCLLKEA